MRGASSVTIIAALKEGLPKQHRSTLVRFTLFLTVLFIVYAGIFQLIMAYEGRDYSIITGFYWTLVVMSTMGFGDVVFESDLGKIFSMLVNITGLVVLIVLLPYIIIEFIYNPLAKAQKDANAPRRLAEGTKNHVIIARHDHIADALIMRLKQHHIPYALMVSDPTEAEKFSDLGFSVLVGNLSQVDFYENARIEDAALLAVNTPSDPINTSIVFSARQASEKLPIVALANREDSIDILELAGATEVLHIADLMGDALARCTSVGGSAHIMGKIDDLLIVEARVAETSLVGQTLREIDLGKKYNITVVGVWERGRFELAGPQTRISENSVLVMGVSEEQLAAYNNNFAKASPSSVSGAVVIGAGSVGIATARALRDREIPFSLLEKEENTIVEREFKENMVYGDAADIHFLKSTSFFEASSLILTTNDDDVNIYLTLYFRKLRPDVQILSRANNERTVSALHHAGADFVLSTSTMSSIALFNHLHQGQFYTMVEGLYAKKLAVPPTMIGKSLVSLQFRVLTGCSVIALEQNGSMTINPSPFEPLPADAEIVVILTPEAEERFIKHFIDVPKAEQRRTSVKAL
ncbi:MAG: NAD-binding protein [Bradymonadales bacterium]|jgi:voltage-gated potassium channel